MGKFSNLDQFLQNSQALTQSRDILGTSGCAIIGNQKLNGARSRDDHHSEVIIRKNRMTRTTILEPSSATHN